MLPHSPKQLKKKREIDISADRLVEILLGLGDEYGLCLLDSCGVAHLGSHLLIAGISPAETLEISDTDTEKTLAILDERLSRPDLAAVFTLSYDFGLKLNRIRSRHGKIDEPDVFLALFDVLIVHDYNTKTTFLTGMEGRFGEIEAILSSAVGNIENDPPDRSKIRSNFVRDNYLDAIEQIQEFIRSGDTYQTNLTQQIRAELPATLRPEIIFKHLRRMHPAPFASFIRRRNDVVISASPERFLKIGSGVISTSPIKGTRPRGATEIEDLELRNELLTSEKDRAENVMIVDLLRNDLGRICEYGSVKVDKLLDLEEHPTLFHLVSTVSGQLRTNIAFSDILRATFPCGSITGAPKIRTMRIIDEIEPDARGLSMGAIGFGISDLGFRIAESGSEAEELGFGNESAKNRSLDSPLATHDSPLSALHSFDLSVAIRTMVVRGDEAVFNVGGGIVIDSEPESEYEETLVKARAILSALNADARDLQKLSGD